MMLKRNLKIGQENYLNNEVVYEWKNPYPCDDCGDVWDKEHLIKHFGSRHLICKKCIDEYHILYVEGN